MNAQSQFSLLDRLAEYRANTQSSLEISFREGEIALPGQPIVVPLLGRGFLRVPPLCWAVVTPASSRPLIFGSGVHCLNLSPGQYPLVYVDRRQHHTRLPAVSAASLDAWQASLALGLLWQVCHPARLLGVDQPLEAMLAACTAAARDYIQTLRHDDLIGAPTATPVPGAAIATAVRDTLSRRLALIGFELLDVLVHDRQGDTRRTDAIQRAIVEKTEVEQTVIVRQEQARLKEAELEQEQHLVERRRALAISEAEIVRVRAEEEQKGRVANAQIAAREAELLRPVQLQGVEVQQRAVEAQQRHERRLKEIEMRGQAIANVAAAIVQAQSVAGLQRSPDPEVGAALSRALEIIATGQLADSAEPNNAALLPPPTNGLRERLWRELNQVTSLPGVTGCDLVESLGREELMAVVHLTDYALHMTCPASYPNNEQPLTLKKTKGPVTAQRFILPWSAGMGLRDIVLAVVQAHEKSTEPVGEAPKARNGHDSRPLVA